MSGFSEDWLGLREPADFAARPPQLLQWLEHTLESKHSLRALDLATGTGSNLRYLATRLGSAQQWTLTDHDPALLAAIPARLAAWAREHKLEVEVDGEEVRVQGPALDCRIESRGVDLAREIGTLDLAGLQLVTTAALLDLVSEQWLATLVRRCRASGTAVLFALSYDGRIVFSQPQPEDDRIVGLVNQHQRTDKGFGLALGPDAGIRAMALLNEAGYQTKCMNSDWRLGPRDRQLQTELVIGWSAAAMEIAPQESALIAGWRERRLRHIAEGHSRLEVGHLDVAGFVPGTHPKAASPLRTG